MNTCLIGGSPLPAGGVAPSPPGAFDFAGPVAPVADVAPLGLSAGSAVLAALLGSGVLSG